MKGIFKTVLAVAALLSALILGFHLGKEKERRKIPEFQED